MIVVSEWTCSGRLVTQNSDRIWCLASSAAVECCLWLRNEWAAAAAADRTHELANADVAAVEVVVDRRFDVAVDVVAADTDVASWAGRTSSWCR